MLEALFLATAKAAPVSTAAASAGTDWKWLVPVATLILGFGLKWFQDHVTEKGRRRHETSLRREQRYDQLRMRRLEAERGNLLALQPLAVRFIRAATVVVGKRRANYVLGRDWCDTPATPDDERELRLSAVELIPLQSRIHTQAAANQLNIVISLVTSVMAARHPLEVDQLWEAVRRENDELHRILGSFIKQLEDENQQLGDPPEQ